MVIVITNIYSFIKRIILEKMKYSKKANHIGKTNHVEKVKYVRTVTLCVKKSYVMKEIGYGSLEHWKIDLITTLFNNLPSNK
jgi:hypothetical protein